MGTVTQYNLANVQAALGGVNPISINEYYRGGLYVPATRTVTISEGPFYAVGTAFDYYWSETSSTNTTTVTWGYDSITPGAYGITFSFPLGPTSYSYAGDIYYREVLQSTVKTRRRYSISRTISVTTIINTGVPSSGQISISQLFGAENP